MLPNSHSQTKPLDSTLLVFGSSGQLASELSLQTMPTGWRLRQLSRQDLDLRNFREVRGIITDAAPIAVINAAAYTAVDKAEQNRQEARIINAEAPIAMAEACAKLGIPFLHVSTDYVFSGDKAGAYREEDEVGPLGVYGASKLEGEEGVRRVWANHVILRTSWVFSRHGANFIKTMLRLTKERDEVRVVADQRGGPTCAADIAETLVSLANQLTKRPEGFGTFHYSGVPSTTWYGFAKAIFASLARRGYHVPRLVAITTEQYPTPAHRPANSVLDCSKLAAAHGILQPSWPEALESCLSSLLTEGAPGIVGR